MKPIPNPLLKRLALTFLVGASCFCVGLVFYFYVQDAIFLGLSCFILIGSCIKCIAFYLLLRNNAYIQLVGICTQIQLKLFTQSYQIILTDEQEKEHTLLISKDYKLHRGSSYRFYFKTASGISPGQNPLLEKAFLTGQLLGVEQIATIIPTTSKSAENYK